MNCLNSMGSGININGYVAPSSILLKSFNNIIYSICYLDDTHIYIGGRFTTPYNYITMWNGTSMTQLVNTFNGYVRTIYARSATQVYIGGGFTTPYNYITMWNGTSMI